MKYKKLAINTYLSHIVTKETKYGSVTLYPPGKVINLGIWAKSGLSSLSLEEASMYPYILYPQAQAE